MTCDPNSKCDETSKQQRPTIRFRRDGEPLVTVAEGNLIRLCRLFLIPSRDPLSKLERARDDLLGSLTLILRRDATDLLADLDEALADLKRESGP